MDFRLRLDASEVSARNKSNLLYLFTILKLQTPFYQLNCADLSGIKIAIKIYLRIDFDGFLLYVSAMSFTS